MKRALLALLALAACDRAAQNAPPAPPLREAPPARAELAEPTSPPEAPPDAAQAEPEAPPLDPEVERKRLADEARKDLGARAEIAVVRDVYVLVAAPGFGGASLKASQRLVDDALAALENGRFDRGPSRPIAVYLFGDAAGYERYCASRYGAPCASKFGFWLAADRRMVMNAGLGLGTLTHELVHPIVDADFPDAPTWIDEGIASLFEAPVLPKRGEIHGAKNWRWPRLVAGLTKGEARLADLVGMSDERFRDADEDLHYAMARYLCQWLDAKGLLWRFYRTWRDAREKDPSGVASFRAVVGEGPDEAQRAWAKWVRSL